MNNRINTLNAYYRMMIPSSKCAVASLYVRKELQNAKPKETTTKSL